MIPFVRGRSERRAVRERRGGRERARRTLVLLSAGLLIPIAGLVAEAQGTPGDIQAREREAWSAIERRQFVSGRELAEQLVRTAPSSYIGHLALALAQHYGEANFPRALYHARLALERYEARHGTATSPSNTDPSAWMWHARILRELAAAHGDLGHHEERITLIEQFNQRYQPPMIAERAWSLMKLGRFEAARAAAQEGLVANDENQTVVALNALCAIEFEAGRDGASYDACGQALAYARSRGRPSVVDLTNFAESARTVFAFEEAERTLLEATTATASWYGNPWLDLAELYTRAGRFAEAAQALEEIPNWRARRPPHVRDSDRNETRRGIVGFMIAAGMHEAALDLTNKAMVTPDRRAHNSRDPAQDVSLTALLDRRARRMTAESIVEAASSAPLHERILAHLRAGWLRAEAWRSGRRATEILTSNDELLVGLLQVGTARSGVTPPWLVGDLVDLFGTGVLAEAIARAAAEDRRDGADAYYAALSAEVALAEGDREALERHAAVALEGIRRGDDLLRARVMALLAAAGETQRFEEVLGIDPGVFRRLEIAVPVSIRVEGDAVAREVEAALARSPRFEIQEDAPLELRVDADAARGRVCLLGAHGRVFGCGDAALEGDEDDTRSLTARLVDATHDAAFAPRINLTQADIHSLDGSTATTRDPLDRMLRP